MINRCLALVLVLAGFRLYAQDPTASEVDSFKNVTAFCELTDIQTDSFDMGQYFAQADSMLFGNPLVDFSDDNTYYIKIYSHGRLTCDEKACGLIADYIRISGYKENTEDTMALKAVANDIMQILTTSIDMQKMNASNCSHYTFTISFRACR